MDKFNGFIASKKAVVQTPVHYASLAFPPEGIDIFHIYTFCEDNGEYYLMDNGVKCDYKIGFIKCFFSPDEGTWEDIIK